MSSSPESSILILSGQGQGQGQQQQQQQQRQQNGVQGGLGLQAVLAAAGDSSSSSAPTKTIVVTKSDALPPIDTLHRAVHKIRLEGLSHNYTEVESAANRQRCSVFVVVKADGYGHGAIATAVYLADSAGADAFAVATLEEGIALRRAFQATAPGCGKQVLTPMPPSSAATTVTTVPMSAAQSVASLFQAPGDDAISALSTGLGVVENHHRQTQTLPSVQHTSTGKRRSLRPPQIRIMVLGPPVGFPRCFDDYYHHNIEVMISGPEVAKSLLEWVVNTDERKRTQVERQANELKELALNDDRPRPGRVAPQVEHRDSNVSNKSSAENYSPENSMDSYENSNNHNHNNNPRRVPQSATLGNVTGSDLANEVREILRNQKSAAAAAAAPPPQHHHSIISSETAPGVPAVINLAPTPAPAPKRFGGIEEAAKMSRTRQKAITSEVFMESGDDDDDDDANNNNNHDTRTCTRTRTRTCSDDKNNNNNNNNATPAALEPTPRKPSPTPTGTKKPPANTPRKRLRWHALVDSGMGRLGFRTDPVSKEEQGKRRDSVEILKELVDLETTSMACNPVEFFGMITHMADANATSDYTNSQIVKFRTLLRRVRAAGISVPTISTDNSAALLTTTLTHFDPKELLTQEHVDTRGFVRTGGAIYGQRPTFPQLRAVSTLMASVRHVAILKKGESVGYDRAYIASRNVRIATLTIGFADGYPRELGNGIGKVSIRGHLFPVVGNVCMDMLMLELGPVGEKDCPGADVVVGDSAILWGPGDDIDEEEGTGMVKLQDIAAILNTTQSALTCGLDKERVRREYG
jgi:alanine racemase